MKADNRQSGNILFIILLAVVLFAALSYSVTQSMRGGGNDATKETLTLKIAHMTEYATLVGQTFNRIQMINQCSDQQMSFQTAGSANYTNPYTPSDHRCEVFHPSGGGVALEHVDPALQISDAEASATWWGTNANIDQKLDYSFPNQTRSLTNMTSANGQFVIGVPFLLTSVCDMINQRVGITNTAALDNTNNFPLGGLSDFYRGVFAPSYDVNTLGQPSVCVYNSRYGNVFIQVIKTR